MYQKIRTIHRLLASVGLPFLLMYGVSAVQMAHGTWFDLKPVVRETRLSLTPGLTDARVIARDVASHAPGVKGELTNVQKNAAGVTLRLVLPGTVHEAQYQEASGEVRLKTSVSGAMGMLNRLHHAAGLWHEPVTMKLWGVVVAVVSTALLLLGATGVYMWFARRTERVLGAALLAVNVLVVIALLGIMRSAGP
jgi:hypothetical protein